jgi:hypothetical protein
MPTKKITEEDVRRIADENVGTEERARSLFRLAYWQLGEYDHLEPAIAALLSHRSATLRGAALKTLLAGWRRPRYIDDAIRILRTDDDLDWSARADAAFSLAAFTLHTGEERERIVRELVHAVRFDESWVVQESSYEQLLKILAPSRDQHFSGEFDRERDVDWRLLGPYLDH